MGSIIVDDSVRTVHECAVGGPSQMYANELDASRPELGEELEDPESEHRSDVSRSWQLSAAAAELCSGAPSDACRCVMLLPGPRARASSIDGVESL